MGQDQLTGDRLSVGIVEKMEHQKIIPYDYEVYTWRTHDGRQMITY